MLTRPVHVPGWIFGLMAFAGGLWSLIGIVAVVAIFQAVVVQRTPFTPDERAFLEGGMPGGTFVDHGTYRRCVNGSVWFFYAGGAQASYSQPCWR